VEVTRGGEIRPPRAHAGELGPGRPPRARAGELRPSQPPRAQVRARVEKRDEVEFKREKEMIEMRGVLWTFLTDLTHLSGLLNGEK